MSHTQVTEYGYKILPDLTKIELVVLSVIFQAIQPNDTFVRAAQKDLAAASKTHPSTTYRALLRLFNKNIITTGVYGRVYLNPLYFFKGFDEFRMREEYNEHRAKRVEEIKERKSRMAKSEIVEDEEGEL